MDYSNEEWREVTDFPGYRVSNLGRVIGLKGDILKPIGKTYLCVNLYKERKMKTVKIHRLVARAFLPIVKGKECVNHKDGNKYNNNVNNLEWCTWQENSLHAHRVLKIQHSGGTKPKSIRCVDTGVVYNSIHEAAESCGGTYQNIRQQIKKGNRAFGKEWEYV